MSLCLPMCLEESGSGRGQGDTRIKLPRDMLPRAHQAASRYACGHKEAAVSTSHAYHNQAPISTRHAYQRGRSMRLATCNRMRKHVSRLWRAMLWRSAAVLPANAGHIKMLLPAKTACTSSPFATSLKPLSRRYQGVIKALLRLKALSRCKQGCVAVTWSSCASASSLVSRGGSEARWMMSFTSSNARHAATCASSGPEDSPSKSVVLSASAASDAAAAVAAPPCVAAAAGVDAAAAVAACVSISMRALA